MYRTEKEISAGGVVFKPVGSGHEVALISRKQGAVWCLPKGKIEPHEKKEETALREVREETGLIGEIVAYLDDIHYWYIDKARALRLNKTVYFFLLTYTGGNINEHDHEVDAVKWFPISTAIKQATYPSERQILEKAKSVLPEK